MMGKTLPKIFLAALAIRWGYDVLLYFAMGHGGLMGVDSSNYIDAGKMFAASLSAGSLQGWHWLGPNPFMMPLHAWLVGISALLAGRYAVLCDVFTQGLFDAATCLVIYGIARTIDWRYATAAAIFAAINPTQIVIAGMVYPDTMFVFFVALFLFGALRWLRMPSWPSILIIIAAAVGAAWSRILMVPFAIGLPFFLALAITVVGRFRRRQLVQLAGMFAIFLLCLAPISLRNKALYGSWALTPQSGIHLARWVVPLIWEARDGTPWARGYAEMERRAAALPHPPGENAFQQSQRYTKVALDELRRIGPAAMAKAWLIGAALNLGTPAIILSPPVSQLPRTGFYATPGKTAFEKVTNFLFHSDNVLYGWILLAGVVGLALIRFLQLAGFAALLTQGHWLPVVLLALWCLFILAVNGPVASPKYRLPMEPALVVLMGAGWSLLWRVKPPAPEIPS
jgi:hypothetical protein